MSSKDYIQNTTLENVKLFSLIFFGSLILNLFLPWWTAGLVALISTLCVAKSANQSLVIGSLSVALLWALVAAYWHISSHGILSEKVANIFNLPNGVTLIIVVFAMAGIFGGSTALCGYYIKDIIKN